MAMTKAVIALWLSTVVSVAASMYAYGWHWGITTVVTENKLDIYGGPSFALAVPEIECQAAAAAFSLIAIISLILSWRVNKQPLFSAPHIAALLLLAPLFVIASLNRIFT